MIGASSWQSHHHINSDSHLVNKRALETMHSYIPKSDDKIPSFVFFPLHVPTAPFDHHSTQGRLAFQYIVCRSCFPSGTLQHQSPSQNVHVGSLCPMPPAPAAVSSPSPGGTALLLVAYSSYCRSVRCGSRCTRNTSDKSHPYVTATMGQHCCATFIHPDTQSAC